MLYIRTGLASEKKKKENNTSCRKLPEFQRYSLLTTLTHAILKHFRCLPTIFKEVQSLKRKSIDFNVFDNLEKI